MPFSARIPQRYKNGSRRIATAPEIGSVLFFRLDQSIGIALTLINHVYLTGL